MSDTGLNMLVSASAVDLRVLQIKLTYVGTQKKPVPTVILTTFYHIPVLEWFTSIRSNALHYENDQIALWGITVTPDEMRQLVKTVAESGIAGTKEKFPEPLVSLMLVTKGSRIGSVGCEFLLGREAYCALGELMRSSLDPTNPLARNVLEQQGELILAAAG